MSGTTPTMKLSLLFSLSILPLLFLGSCTAKPKQPLTEAEATEMVRSAMLEAIEADTQGDDYYQSYYVEPLQTLENKCSEPFITTLKMTVHRTDELGQLGRQFGWLNTLEATAYALENTQGPVQCEPVISQVKY